ncbi:MAG: hypothetical protein ABIT76_11380 [Chthoniobacterales bacterium]
MILVVFALEHEARDFARWLRTHPSSIQMELIGVGAESVSAKLPTLLEKHRPSQLVAGGFAGALTDEWKIGDVFCATNFSTIPSRLRGAVLHSSSSVIEKDHARLAAQADCVDMESATVAQIAVSMGVPLLVLRTISDTPGQPIPIPFAVTYDLARQKIQATSILLWLARHPARWLAFARFLTDLRRARRSLTIALIDILQHE